MTTLPTMNREERRRLQRATKAKIRKDGKDRGVMLRGGPMDGWFVKIDAPALRPEWGVPHGGRYEDAGRDKDGVRVADWKPWTAGL